MAKEASLCLLFLSFLIICCSGTLVGFSYRGTGDTASSTFAATTFLQRNKISQSQIRFFATDPKILSTLTNSNVSLSVDFFLNKSLVENFISSKSSGVSWLRTHLVSILTKVDIRSIIVSYGSESLGQNEISLLLSALKSIHSVLSKLQLSKEVKVSVAFPLSFLENLNPSDENDLCRIIWFIKKINSFIMIEDNIDGELSMGDNFVQSIITRATIAACILPCNDVPMVLAIKSAVLPSSMELVQFSEAVSKYLEAKSQITKRLVALYVEVDTAEDFGQKEIRRQEEEIFPLSHIRRTLQDTNNSPSPVFPTNPTSATPVITPPDTPTIITVPSTNPVTVSPTNPAATPVTVPSTTPVPIPPSNPANSPVPVTNPVPAPITVPGAQPVTNPVTSSYPPPSGSVPLMNPQPPPANTNAQAMPGQGWCVAKTGVPETQLQSALDYACSSVDCSQIQQGGSCYSPNSVQNHASFAFNSYYQKNPAPTSCDFGGSATIVNTNPSSGTCIYPSSSGAGTSGSVASPSQSPPDFNTSHSAGLSPFLGCMVLVISLVSGRLSIRP
ncbi:X8 domain [Sesbania bispinosa]|nr:X8 domain [Sesbania bispinosa]